MAEKDYYSILGVSHDASQDDIKKAFKKLAMKYHPDRQNGKSEAERKEAEEKFKEINEANDVLSDPDKKQQYDMFGSMDENDDPFARFRNFNPFSGFGGFRQRGPEPGESLRVSVTVSLEEIYNGGNRDIEYNVFEKCPHCHGEGGTDIETCPHCHGTGMITETRRMGNSIIQNSHPCGHCAGAGKTMKHKCTHCGGSGFVKAKKTLNVNIPVGVMHGEQFRYNGRGSESREGGPNGDLYVQFIYNVNDTRFKIRDNDIYELVNIPYYDCILGCEMNVTLPNKKQVKYNVPAGSSSGSTITLKGHGIKGGNWVVVVNPVMPTKLSNEEERLLREIKALKKK